MFRWAALSSLSLSAERYILVLIYLDDAGESRDVARLLVLVEPPRKRSVLEL
jgi:hypothetical protein